MMTPSERTILFYLCDAIEAVPEKAPSLVKIVDHMAGSEQFQAVLTLLRASCEPRRDAQVVRVLIS